MKRFYKMFACWVFVFFLVFSLGMQSHASLESLLISTDSNALMTMELDDSDYSVMPLSSFGTVTNTIDSNSINVDFRVTDENGNHKYGSTVASIVNGRYRLSINLDGNSSWTANSSITGIYPYLYKEQLPPSGSYAFSYDYSSDFSYEYSSAQFRFRKKVENASWTEKYVTIYPSFGSGDFYLSPYNLNLTNLNEFYINMNISYSENVRRVAGSFAFNFKPIESGDYLSTSVNDTTDSDYQSDVSSSLSDLSSSVDTMTDEISGVTEAIQNLQGAMEPHYSNVLTQLHHITEQLHAFYDQIYNNIHLKEYALWQDIKTAIENIDLEVNVNLDKLKTSIDNMSTAIQNKLQSVQEAITNGFDNQGINQDAAELDQSLQEYEEAEQTVLDQVNDSLDDFEFDSGFDEYKTTISVFSDFLQDLYDSSGGFKVVINLSLMLSIAGIVIGVYRFRDGG